MSILLHHHLLHGVSTARTPRWAITLKALVRCHQHECITFLMEQAYLIGLVRILMRHLVDTLLAEQDTLANFVLVIIVFNIEFILVMKSRLTIGYGMK